MKFKGGINQDAQPVNQPEGSWRVAKNVVIDGPGNVVNEEGFNLTANFPADFMLMGQIPVTGDRVVVFLVDAPTGENFSQIGIVDGAGNYTLLSDNSAVLQFNENYPVSGDFIFNGDGELIVIFTDNRKEVPPKLINLLQADTLITIDSANLTSLFPDTSLPLTVVSSVTSGGSLATGAYQFAFSYELPDGSSTNWLSLTNPVIVYDGSVADTYNVVDGSKPGINAGKSIGMTLSNVDVRYAKIKMAVVKKIDGIITAEDVSSFVITDAVTRVVYTGDEVTTDLLLEEILADRAIFDRIKSMKILNDRLYLGNVSQTNITDYQQYANNIALKWYGRDQVSMDAAKTSHKDPITVYTKRSFMPGEVYAFYIRFILTNGSTSPAFHIPGRPPNLVYDHITNTWNSNAAPVDEDSVTTLTEFTSVNTRARYFHFYETGDATLKDFNATAVTIGGNLGYWENLDERYASLEYDSSGSGGRNLLAEGLNANAVKHHKFPSLTKLEDWGFPIMTEDISQSGPVSQFQTSTIWETSLLMPAFEQDRHHIAYTNDTGEELVNVTINLGGILNLTVGNYPPPNQANPPSDYSVALMAFIGPYEQYKSVILDDFLDASDGWMNNIDGYLPNTNDAIFVLDAQTLRWSGSILPWSDSAGDWTNDDHQFNITKTAWTLSPGEQINYVVKKWKDNSNFPNATYDSNTPGGVYTDNGNANLYGTNTLDIVGEGIISGTVFGTKYGHPLGIIAENIVIPEEIRNEIQGFEILYAEKTISNSLSLGTSVVFHGENPTSTAAVVAPDDYVRLYPPDMLQFKPNNKPTHLKWELETSVKVDGELTWQDSTTGIYGSGNDGHRVGTIPDMVMDDWGVPNNITGWPGTTKHFIRQITNAQYLPINNSAAIINNAFREAAYYAELPGGYDSEVTTARYMVSLQIFKDNLYNSLYEQPLVATGKIFPVSDGVGDYIFGRNTGQQPIYGGDTFLSPYFQVITRPSTDAETDIGIIPNTPGTTDQKGVIAVYGWPVYSAVNTGLYNKGDEWWETYYPKSLTSRVADMPTGFTTPGSYDSNEGIPHIEGGGSAGWAPKTKGHYFMTIPEGKYYNTDFTTINTLEAGNIPYDPLVNYLEEFPQLVARSLKASRVEPMANIRKFLAEDVYEMPKNRGEIWHLDALGDMLLIHHEFALFRTVGKEVLKVGVSEVTVGTGDIFEREPKEVIPSSPGGVAGTTSKYAAFTCRLGYFFVDQAQGKVFLLTDTLRELSSEGLKIFFRDNLPLSNNQDNPYAGIGMTAAYDRKYNRIILSKVDGLNNPWTVSFSADNDAWVSFHDYNPAVLFSADTLFSAQSEKIWVHNAGNRCLFYDQTTPAVTSIDTVFVGNLGSGVSASFSNIYWQADLVNSNGVYLRTTPLTEVFVYNNNQASGSIVLNSSNTATNVRNVHNLWKFNKFRDIAIRGDVVLGPPFYNINTTALDPTLVWWKRKRFMDQFMITRLTYDNTDQNTLYLYSVETDTLPLLR